MTGRGKILAGLFTLAVLYTFAPVTDTKADDTDTNTKTITDNDSYTVTIPTELSVGTDGTGSMEVSATMDAYRKLDISIGSDYKLECGTRKVGYSLSGTTGFSDTEKKIIYSTMDSKDGSEEKFSTTLTAKVNDTAPISGTYEDKLTFTISCQADSTVRYKLKFDANGGTVEITNKELASGTQYGTLPVPERSGYTFDGWFTKTEGGSRVSETTKMDDSDVIIYAHWTQDNYDSDEYTEYYYYEKAFYSDSAHTTALAQKTIREIIALNNTKTRIQLDSTYTISNSETWNPSEEVVITRNTRERMIEVMNGGTLTLEGKLMIDGNYTSSEQMTAINAHTGAVINIKSGTIIKNCVTVGARAGAIYITGGTVNMSGGILRENSAGASAGCILIDAAGVFNMSGGQILNNTSVGNGSGIAISDNKGTINISGGTIADNIVNDTEKVSNPVNILGSAVITGGSVESISGSVTDENNTALICCSNATSVKTSSAVTEIKYVTNGGSEQSYTCNDIYTNSLGYVYLWLPAGSKITSMTVAGEITTFSNEDDASNIAETALFSDSPEEEAVQEENDGDAEEELTIEIEESEDSSVELEELQENCMSEVSETAETDKGNGEVLQSTPENDMETSGGISDEESGTETGESAESENELQKTTE